ncbi:DUF5610 domain-containing protein [Marinobacter sp. JSM 1782161]|uniref:DUF5610 domain-containing protein n=1 Tax=Marinobacter sp. JSM 1782161 TaxID=2685906 RepID=UPI001402C0CC|nr:DUF5610 domain-containing protein [Marinobacter sp. JSM 1782161]
MIDSIRSGGADYLGRQPRQDGATGGKPGSERAGRSAPGESSVRTPQDAIDVLRARLDQRLQAAMSSGRDTGASGRTASSSFEPPSAADVAGRVLGFVQSRLQQEADAGADSERLSSLMEQARAGVEQGFAEAREQIEALGMMSDDLSAGIDDSFSRIQQGLDQLSKRFLNEPGATPASQVSASRVEAASRDQLAFEVRTRDGDVVTVRMDEQRYAGVSQASVTSDAGRASQSSSVSLFAGSYQFAVEGELDDGERAALTELFEDVQSVAGRFFDGDIQSAFSAAQSLGLDGEELASFSLNLSSSRTVSASAYESVAGETSAASRLRPLAGLAGEVQDLARQASGQGVDGASLASLMDQIVSDLDASASRPLESDTADLMNEFWKAIIGGLESGADDSDS